MPINKTNIKKDGKQQYRVRVNYTDSHGHYRQVERTTYGSTEAKMLESKLLKEYAEKNAIPASKMALAALYEEYIEVKGREVRASSLATLKNILTKHILPYIGEIRLDKLSVPQLQKWKTELSGQGLSATTLKHCYGELRALLNYALKMEYINRNPLLSVGNFRESYFEHPHEKLHYYTAAQFLRFISQARTYAEQSKTMSEWGYYVFFAIAYYTGARKGEINALKWSDLDGDIMHIRRSVTQKLKGGDVETPPKNQSSYRNLQIPAPLVRILDEHRKRQSSDRLFTDDYRICGGAHCLRDTSIENKNTKYAEAAGLPHIRIHDFRHSHASLLANEGINIQEIARRLGHSNIQQTWQTYAHLYPREEERAISILDKVK